MKEDLQDRVLQSAYHIIETGDTIRKTALVYSYSKSTVHNDVSIKLKKINFNLYKQVNDILKNNFAQKHIRGGQATKKKYQRLKEIKWRY